MACVNIDNLLYVKTYSLHNKEVVKIEPNVGYIAKENFEKDFFYIQFSTVDSFSMFPLDTIVPANILEKIKRKEIFLILDNGLEHFYECADEVE